MKQDELILERECREMARKAGWIAVKLEKNGHKGIPDDLFIRDENTWFLCEFKKDFRQKLRPEQVTWLNRLPTKIKKIYKSEDFAELLKL